MLRTRLILACVSALSAAACAQNPLRHPSDAAEIRFDSSQPVLSYRLQIDSADLSSVAVEMHVRNVPDTFRVAMVRHLHTGDTLAVEVRHRGRFMRTVVAVSGYDRPSVRIEEVRGATERQRRLRGRWEACDP